MPPETKRLCRATTASGEHWLVDGDVESAAYDLQARGVDAAIGTWHPDSDGLRAARGVAGELVGMVDGYRRFLDREAVDHPLRDELLAQVDAVLAKARGEASDG